MRSIERWRNGAIGFMLGFSAGVWSAYVLFIWKAAS